MESAAETAVHEWHETAAREQHVRERQRHVGNVELQTCGKSTVVTKEKQRVCLVTSVP